MKFPLSHVIFLLLSFALYLGNPVKALSQENTTTVDEFFSQGTSYLFEGSLDQSILSFVNAEAGYQKSNNVQQIIACYLGIATGYCLQGNFQKSLEYNEKALSLHKSRITDDPERLDLIISNIALCKEARRLSIGSIEN